MLCYVRSAEVCTYRFEHYTDGFFNIPGGLWSRRKN